MVLYPGSLPGAVMTAKNGSTTAHATAMLTFTGGTTGRHLRRQADV